MNRMRSLLLLLGLPSLALAAFPTDAPSASLATPSEAAAAARSAGVQAESLKALKATIDERKNGTPKSVFEQVGKMKTGAAFKVLQSAASTINALPGKTKALSAMRHMLTEEKLKKQVLDHVGHLALEAKDADSEAAVRALAQFGAPGKEILRRVLVDAKAPRGRRVAFGPMHKELMEEGGPEVRDLVLANFDLPKSGSEQRALELLSLFGSEDDAKVFKSYVTDEEHPISLRRLVVRSMEAHAAAKSYGASGRPKKPDPVEAVILKALKSDEPRLEYQGIQSATRRLAPISEATLRTVKKLVKSDDDAIRRAATLLVLEKGNGKLNPLKLAEARDSMMRQAAAITLGKSSGDPAFNALAELATDDNWPVKAEAIRGLLSQRDRRAIPLLVDRINREEGRLVADLATALEQLTGRDYGNSPKTWQRFWSKEGDGFEMPSRAEAAKALETRAARRAENSANGASVASFYGLDVISDQFAVVFDASLSMNSKGKSGKRRIDTAKEQLNGMIERLKEGTLFNLLPFAARVEPLWDELSPLNEDSGDEALRFTKDLKMKLGTDIYDGLFTAFLDDRVDTIFVLSDGASTEGVVKDPDGLKEEVARWNSVRGITIHCIAIGTDHRLLRGLAEDSGGTYIRVD